MQIEETKKEVLMTLHAGRITDHEHSQVVTVMSWSDFCRDSNRLRQHEQLLAQRFPTDHDARQLARKRRAFDFFAEDSGIAFISQNGTIISAAQALAGDDVNRWCLENVITMPGHERQGCASVVCRMLALYMQQMGYRWGILGCQLMHADLYARVLRAIIREEWEVEDSAAERAVA